MTAGGTILGRSVTIFGLTGGTGAPVSVLEAVLGAIFIVAGVVTEISAEVWLLSACNGAFP